MYGQTFIVFGVMVYFVESSTDRFSFCPEDFGNKTPIYIAGFYSYSERSDVTGRIPAAELAVEHVNNSTDMLKRYHICVLWRNSKCLSSGGIWAFYKHLAEKPTKVAILGPPCSTSTIPVAETAHQANLTTMSYWASSPSLSDRERYPYFFRTFLSELLLNPPKIKLLERFNWAYIGTITQNEDIFTWAHEDLLTGLQESSLSITPAVQEIFDKEPTERQIRRFKDAELKIFIFFSYEDTARNLFCKAYQNQMYGQGYAWLIIGWFSDEWWIKDTEIDNCTNEQIETAVVESLYITTESNIDTEGSEDIAISGIRAKDFNELMRIKEKELRRSGAGPSKYTYERVEGFAYDAVWTIALSLNETAKKFPIENFTYDDYHMGREIFEAMNEVNFTGVTGEVTFEAGDRDGSVSVEQLQALPCEDDGRYFWFFCYDFVTSPLAWVEAGEYCMANNQTSFLVSILSEREFNFLVDVIEELNGENDELREWFIGLTYEHQRLTWVNTSVMGDPLWTPSSSFNKEGSCYTLRPYNETWTSLKLEECNRPKPFICKRRPKFSEKVIFTSGTDGSLKRIENRTLIWHDGTPPRDRDVIEDALTVPQYIAMAGFSGLGFATAVIFLIFNIKAQNHKFVKLSSPRLNNLIIAGAIVIYLSIGAVGLEVKFEEERETYPFFCMLHVWLILIGFVLGFGALFSKTWRVYKIADIRGARSLITKDSELFVQVGVILLIGVAILAAWSVVDPLHHVTVYTSVNRYIQTCTCKHFTIWAAVVFLYIGIILIFGVFLAWHTRNVTIQALNDSKLIGVCIYNITILVAVTVGVCASIQDNPAFRYMFISAITGICATFTLLIIFVPKVIFVLRYPNADRKECTTTSHSMSNIASTRNVDIRVPQDDNPPTGSLWFRLKKRLLDLTGFESGLRLRRRAHTRRNRPTVQTVS